MKTLTIFDWDDTLYPTIHTIMQGEDNDINYELVDDKIYKLFELILKYSLILIISDASKAWILKSLQDLEKTRQLFNDNQIKIISTYDIIILYNELYEDKIYYLNENKKIKIFDIIDRLFKDYNNIISVGDSKKEYSALSYISKKSTNKYKLFKNIKFFNYPTTNLLIEELKLLCRYYPEIYKSEKCEDLLINIF